MRKRATGRKVQGDCREFSKARPWAQTLWQENDNNKYSRRNIGKYSKYEYWEISKDQDTVRVPI